MIASRGVLRALVLAAMAWLACSAPVVASAADPPPGTHVDEIEQRLKTAGVDPALRARIHKAIRRGVLRLLKVQRKDGAIVGDLAPNSPFPVGYTALGALALAHSGYPDALDGADRALNWLVPEGKPPKKKVTGGIYEGGIMAMLLKARGTHPDIARRIVNAFIAVQDDSSGWWAYCTDDCQRCSWRTMGKTLFNLSTSQFAALGLWAGEDAADHGFGEPLTDAWEKHLESLLTLQLTKGNWAYAPKSQAVLSVNHTSMGLANLLLAQGALADRLNEDPRLVERVATARARAMERLGVDAAQLLDAPAFKGALDFYGYYALEKACVFANVETVGRRQWYIDGAKRLLDVQLDNGGWVGSWGRAKGSAGHNEDVTATSFALLFLLRVSETYRPTTPRDVPRPRPKGVVTPSDRDGGAQGKSPVPKVKPRPPAIPLSQAEASLEELAKELKRRTLRVKELSDIVTALDQAQQRLGPDPQPKSDDPSAEFAAEMRFVKARQAWRERLDDLLALGFGRCVTDQSRDKTERLAILFADVISRGGAGAARKLRPRLPKSLRGRLDDTPSPQRYDAALRAIGAAGDDGTVHWLQQQVSIANERRPIRMSRAALLGLATVKDAPGAARRDAVRALVKRLAPLERKALSGDDDLKARLDAIHWSLLEPRAIDALLNLCRDPDTGDVPLINADGSRATLRRLREWLKAHDDVRAAPWRAE